MSRRFVGVGYALAAAFVLLGLAAGTPRATILSLCCAATLTWAARAARLPR